MLVQIALTLTLLLGFCGLALDVGLMQLKKIQLQNTADAAALGAMYALGSGTSLGAAAQADAALNGYTSGKNGFFVFTPENPPMTGIYAGDASAVRVTVSQSVQTIFFPGPRTITAQATAVSPQVPCGFLLSQADTTTDSIYALNESLSSNGNNCGIYLGRSYSFQTNSSSSGYQFLVSSSSTATSSGSVSPAPSRTAPQPDPLSYLQPPPAPSGCTYTNAVYKSYASNPTHIAPGVYCGGLQILCSGSTEVIMDPGIYYIAGQFLSGNPSDSSCSGGTRLSGSGVTVYMTQLTGYPCGQADFNNYLLALSAPTSGPLKGIFFFTDRSLPAGKSTVTFEAPNPQSTIDGILYLPGQQLNLPDSILQGTQYLGVVADNLNMHNTTLYLSADYSSIGGNPFRSPGGGLVE